MITTTHTLESRRTATLKSRTPAPTGRVVDLLREINIALHATRVIGRLDEVDVPVERETATSQK